MFTPLGWIFLRGFPATPQMQVSDRNVTLGLTERQIRMRGSPQLPPESLRAQVLVLSQ